MLASANSDVVIPRWIIVLFLVIGVLLLCVAYARTMLGAENQKVPPSNVNVVCVLNACSILQCVMFSLLNAGQKWFGRTRIWGSRKDSLRAWIKLRMCVTIFNLFCAGI